MSYMSLMQRPSGPSCCSGPCQLRRQPLSCPARGSFLMAGPKVQSSRTSRVVASGTRKDNSETKKGKSFKDIKSKEELKTMSTDELIDLIEGDSVIAWLPDKRALLEAALLKAPFQLLGGIGIFVDAALNPNFPTGIVGLILLLSGLQLIGVALVAPVFWYAQMKNHEKRCLRCWDKEVVEYFMKAQGPHS